MPAPPNIVAHKPHFHRNEAWKQPVRAATTAAGTLGSSFENGDSAGGVTLATGDRLLVKSQADAAENGIYVVEATGTPTRAFDADVAAEFVGATVLVREGTLAGSIWRCTNTTDPELGTDDISWAEVVTGSSSSLALDDLTDVTITSPVTGHLLRYNGSAWVNAAPTTSELLISDTPSTPLVFADILQNEAQDDLLYND